MFKADVTSDKPSLFKRTFTEVAAEKVFVPLKDYLLATVRLVMHPTYFVEQVVAGKIALKDSLKYYMVSSALTLTAISAFGLTSPLTPNLQWI